jgi:hypothetical protein
MHTIRFLYNFKGEKKEQTVIPQDIYYSEAGYEKYDLQPGWYLRAFDPKQGQRSFAFANIENPGSDIIRGNCLVIFPREWLEGAAIL